MIAWLVSTSNALVHAIVTQLRAIACTSALLVLTNQAIIPKGNKQSFMLLVRGASCQGSICMLLLAIFSFGTTGRPRQHAAA